MSNQIADVIYQVHMPSPAGIPGPTDVYRRDAQEVLVVYDGTDSGLATVLNNNITLQPGEVYDILSVTADPYGTKGLAIFQ